MAMQKRITMIADPKTASTIVQTLVDCVIDMRIETIEVPNGAAKVSPDGAPRPRRTFKKGAQKLVAETYKAGDTIVQGSLAKLFKDHGYSPGSAGAQLSRMQKYGIVRRLSGRGDTSAWKVLKTPPRGNYKDHQ